MSLESVVKTYRRVETLNKNQLYIYIALVVEAFVVFWGRVSDGFVGVGVSTVSTVSG